MSGIVFSYCSGRYRKAYWQALDAQVSLQIALDERVQSEDRLRLTLDGGQIGSWDWNLTNNKVWRSPNHDALFGLKEDLDVFDRDVFFTLVHPEDRMRVGEVIEAALSEGKPYKIEYRVFHHDGSIHWLASRATVIRDKEGRPFRIAGSTGDVTELKSIELRCEPRFNLETIFLDRLARIKNAADFTYAPVTNGERSLRPVARFADGSKAKSNALRIGE